MILHSVPEIERGSPERDGEEGEGEGGEGLVLEYSRSWMRIYNDEEDNDDFDDNDDEPPVELVEGDEVDD